MSAATPRSERSIEWIAHAPVALFAIVMGLSGLGLVWRKAHEVFGYSALIGEVIVGFSILCFIILSILYLVKFCVFKEFVFDEFLHPVQVNFFPSITISLLLISAVILPYDAVASENIWLISAAAHLGLSIIIINRWITHNFEIKHSNPSWFIPVVGNITVPLAGAQLGYVEISWFFFSIGLVFWVILFTIMMYRIIFHDQLPKKFLPTLFILMAPPGIGFNVYLFLNGGELDLLARLLFFTGLFILLLLFSMMKLFIKIPFSVSWWAYTFPSAAMAIAALRYHELIHTSGSMIMAIGIMLIATTLILLVTWCTVRAIFKGQLFILATD
uniref:SLAC1 anion channel family protein n=1 Tax=Marinobacterium profundum TaxID=1714300 RepID=UPI0008314C78|nr:SLAC1 anion channel family protein [Marinobacterium profundum]